MAKHLSKIFMTFLYLSVLNLLSSCYSNFEIHEPYDVRKKITPPPPVPKKLAAPLSKSEYMQKTFTEIKSTLSEADVVLIEDSIKVLFPNNIVYEKSSIIPNSNYQEPLSRFASLLNKYLKTEILIAGHTDNRGDSAMNKSLSKSRADNIKMFLVQKNVSIKRLESLGIGDIAPVASNETEEGRMKNRRVEFVVLYRE